MRYMEQNPVRTDLVEAAEAYPWSSARTHVTCSDEWNSLNLVDLEEICDRQRRWQIVSAAAERQEHEMLERATYGGKRCGGAGSRSELSVRVGRDLGMRRLGQLGKVAEHAMPKMANC